MKACLVFIHFYYAVKGTFFKIMQNYLIRKLLSGILLLP